ncbi:ig-like domain-containing protein [Trichonephila clavipes]|nr:ig-like domain-containing protein [Trichonephila clavipes]
MTVALVEAFIIGKRGSYAALRGSNLRMSCIPRESDTREERDTVMTYTWTDDQGREVVDARFTKFENGDLEIVNAHVSDSGIYKCKPETSSSTSTAQPKNVYEHKLIETKLPVRLINTTNERRLFQGHERTPLRVKGDIEDVSSELDNEGQMLHFSGARVQWNSSTVMRVWKQGTDEHRTTRKTGSGRLKVTLARDDRHLFRMTVNDGTSSSRKLAARWSTAIGVLMSASLIR